ncbi:hypothetical protein A9Q81_21940 [Gammaproteobacteria bacterium 42_54_T18]|nr:hypothetical protein A9Q81_21940 [Gammaproteobacteria bacterium 42_54_T18]
MTNRPDAKKALSNKQIGDICELIIHWNKDKLTWHGLTKSIEDILGIKVSRQTLSSYFAIKKEYQLKKGRLRNIGVENRTPCASVSEHDLLEKVARLERDKEYLQRQCHAQLEKIQCMIHNAQRHNPRIDIRELMAPLLKTIRQ